MISSLQTSIESSLQKAFSPARLVVQDDSAQHAGHAGARPEGGTHFSVAIVSSQFADKTLMERHRMVYKTLQPIMKEAGIHALGIRTWTEEEWNTL